MSDASFIQGRSDYRSQASVRAQATAPGKQPMTASRASSSSRPPARDQQDAIQCFAGVGAAAASEDLWLAAIRPDVHATVIQRQVDDNAPSVGDDAQVPIADRLIAALRSGDDLEEAVQSLLWLADPEDVFDVIQDIDPGLFDSLVEAIPESADGVYGMKRLIRYRYNIAEVAGHWDVAGLRRAWTVLACVPPDHIDSDDNMYLQRLLGRLVSSGGGVSGSFDKDREEIAINYGDEGGLDAEKQATEGDGATVFAGEKAFDWALLHEIGHTVDETLGAMDYLGERPSFGAWAEYSMAEAADAMAERARLDATTTNILYNLVTGADLVSAINAYTDPDVVEGDQTYTEYQSMPAVQAVLDHRPPHFHGLQGPADDQPVADTFDGHVFFSQSGTWYSYDFAARKEQISNYQFRAPAEFFAEIYAAYYMGVLPAGHSLHDWFEVEIHENEGLDPDVVTGESAASE